MRRIKNPSKSHESFEEWFDGSVTVNEDGSPIVFYHGTSAKNFDEFKYGYVFEKDRLDKEDRDQSYSFDFNSFLGPHFTTDPSIASRFASNELMWKSRNIKGFRIIPVYLKLENPLYFSGEKSLLYEIVDLGKGTREEKNAIEDYIQYRLDIDTEDEDEFDTEFERIKENDRERLAIIDSIDDDDEKANVMFAIAEKAKRSYKSSGYDGIIYKNDHEGGFGYIPFSEKQIWWILKKDTPPIRKTKK